MIAPSVSLVMSDIIMANLIYEVKLTDEAPGTFKVPGTSFNQVV